MLLNNFKLINRISIVPLVHEIENATCWNWLNLRRTEGLNHKSVDDIVLRFNPVQSMYTHEDFFNELGCVDYFTQQFFPYTMAEVQRLAAGKVIGRIVIAKLKSGGIIDKHIDEGNYAKWYDRYHFVITTNPSVFIYCGEEKLHMGSGEVWWFDNKTEHSVVNCGDTDRIHVVVDLRKF